MMTTPIRRPARVMECLPNVVITRQSYDSEECRSIGVSKVTDLRDGDARTCGRMYVKGTRPAVCLSEIPLSVGPILASISAAPWPDDVPVFGRKGTKGQHVPSKRAGAFRSTVCGIAQSNQRHIFRPDSDRHNQRICG
jgi:hypothetical protein